MKYLLLLIPPLFYLSNLKKIKNFIFNFYKKNHIEIKKSNYKRHAFVNKAINKFDNCKYLEIGTLKNDLFNSIPLPMHSKFGVDPVSGGNYRMTSDLFFEKYKNLKFDVIFIDGLHEYKACQNDILNSIKVITENGIIFIDDVLPKNELEQKVPRAQSYWLGDVWKVAVELNNSINIDFKIIDVDSGIGVIKLKKNFVYNKMPDLTYATYDNFLLHYEKFNIIDSEEALEFINSL